MNIFKQELLDSMNTLNEHQTCSKMEQLPQLTMKMDTIKDRIDVTKVVESTISKTNESLFFAMNTVSEQVSTMTNKVESFSSVRRVRKDCKKFYLLVMVGDKINSS